MIWHNISEKNLIDCMGKLGRHLFSRSVTWPREPVQQKLTIDGHGLQTTVPKIIATTFFKQKNAELLILLWDYLDNLDSYGEIVLPTMTK